MSEGNEASPTVTQNGHTERGNPLAAFVVILLVPSLHGFFELRLLPPLDYVLIGAVVIVWGFVLRFAWRKGLFEWLLNLA